MFPMMVQGSTHSTKSRLISNGEPKGIQPFSVSHVVLSDPTSARGREERGRTDRDEQQMAGNEGKGTGGMREKKRTHEKDAERIKAHWYERRQGRG